MVIAFVSARYKTILEWLNQSKSEQVTHIGVIKRNGPTLYLYVETAYPTFHELFHYFDQVIKENGGMNYVYAFYSVYNGMIDYSVYLRPETKDSMKYYQSSRKDITHQEIENYKKSHL